ncbi:MAG: hypothetical protein Q9227_000614 [Pyrenula ochraceoflavens]
MDSTSASQAEWSANKRPRSPSGDLAHPPSKVAKMSQHLQINYLQRQFNDNIPLVGVDQDSLPTILRLIGDYDGVLQRHESIAGNLGACPLGPILVKRFERLFDGPPRILKSHGKETAVSWLDVVEFARNKPEQFNLEKTRNGVRVCQFYTKQCRVEISEEDFVLISSGMPQKLIPPQPIVEDEEKELVSARARQLNHRLKNRKAAIISRRENEAAISKAFARLPSPSSSGQADGANGGNSSNPAINGHPPELTSPQGGFTAVNNPSMLAGDYSSADAASLGISTDKVTMINGTDLKGASPAVKAELMKKFFSTADKSPHTLEEDLRRASPSVGRPPIVPPRTTRPRGDSLDYSGSGPSLNSPLGATAVAIPSTPASLLPHSKPATADRDDGGPYKAEMVVRMDQIQRGERILPPCDRCRRLHMDCLKNLTACMGCTKKHAKCSWRDVRESELRDTDARDVEADGSADARHSRDESYDGFEHHEPIPEPTQEELQPALEPVSVKERSETPEKLNGNSGHDSQANTTPAAAPSPPRPIDEPTSQSFVPPAAPAPAPAESDSSTRAIEKHLPEAATSMPFRRIPRVEPVTRPPYQVPDDDDDDEDEGDRLQAAATQVYRTASQQGTRTKV